MPTDLTETATFDAVVTVPSDGDARTSASVRTFAQQLANRTKFLKGVIDTGVPRIKTVASGAALAAVAPGDRADGDIIAIADPTDPELHVGLYRFNSAATSAGSTILAPGIGTPKPLIVVPSSGGGRWIALDMAAYKPLATASAAQRFTLPVPNAIVHDALRAYTVTDPFNGNTSGSWESTGVNSDATSVLAGDIIEAHAVFGAEGAQSASFLAFRLKLDDGTVLATGGEVSTSSASATAIPWHLRTRFVAPAAASITVGVQVKHANGYNVRVYKPCEVGIRVIRP